MTDPIPRGNAIGCGKLWSTCQIVAVPLLFVLVAVITWPLTSDCHPDLGLYRRAAEQIMQGQLPYRDFRFEYPPFAAIACLAPIPFSMGDLSPERFRWGFLFANGVYLTIMAGTLRLTSNQKAQDEPIQLWVLTLGAGILSPFLAWRYDLFPAMLTSIAFLASTRGRAFLAGVPTGLAISAKLYPVVLLPVLCIMFTRRGELKSGLFMGLAAFGSLGLTLLPFIPDGMTGLGKMLTFHNQRGVHVESLSGGIVLLSNLLSGQFTPLGVSYGAWHIHSPVSDALASLHGAFFLSLYAIFILIAWQRIAQSRTQLIGARDLAVLSVGALLVFILSNKVLSPQYLAWLFPFVPFLRPFQAILFLLSCAASILIFPVAYDALLHEEPWAVILLNMRNGIMLLLLISVLLDLTGKPSATSGTT